MSEIKIDDIVSFELTNGRIESGVLIEELDLAYLIREYTSEGWIKKGIEKRFVKRFGVVKGDNFEIYLANAGNFEHELSIQISEAMR